jgi:hypothetical protein
MSRKPRYISLCVDTPAGPFTKRPERLTTPGVTQDELRPTLVYLVKYGGQPLQVCNPKRVGAILTKDTAVLDSIGWI